jgi:hypothetical protein
VVEFPQPRFIRRILSAIFASIVVNSVLVWVSSPWLQKSLIYSMDLSNRLEMTVLVLLYMITFIILNVATLWLLLSSRLTEISRFMKPRNGPTENQQAKEKAVLDEIFQIGPYLTLLQQQLDGAIKDTEIGVIALIKCLNEIHHLSNSQVDRISESMRNVMILSDILREQSTHNKDFIDSSSMESRFNEGNKMLLDVISALDAGNNKVIERLSEALSCLQFQDVLRQRVEQVQSAIHDLDEHFIVLANHFSDSVGDRHLSPTLKERMESHFDQYVMSSQREVYASVTGNMRSEEGDRPKIELF